METGTGFLDQFNNALDYLSGLVWGPPMLVLLVGTGIYLTLALRGLQFSTLLLLPTIYSLLDWRD